MGAARAPARRMLVVTCGVQSSDIDELELTVRGNTVHVIGPGGFAHDLELPPEANMNKLEVELYQSFLELRAPRSSKHEGGLQ